MLAITGAIKTIARTTAHCLVMGNGLHVRDENYLLIQAVMNTQCCVNHKFHVKHIAVSKMKSAQNCNVIRRLPIANAISASGILMNNMPLHISSRK
jgi:hypothetical protein